MTFWFIDQDSTTKSHQPGCIRIFLILYSVLILSTFSKMLFQILHIKHNSYKNHSIPDNLYSKIFPVFHFSLLCCYIICLIFPLLHQTTSITSPNLFYPHNSDICIYAHVIHTKNFVRLTVYID